MYKKIKTFLYEYLIQILLVVISVFWIILFINGQISNRRIIIFILVLLYIWVYKWLMLFIVNLDPMRIKNETFLKCIIYIDKIKLIILNIIMYIYIWFFNVLNWSKEQELIRVYKGLKFIKWIVKYIILHPILIIIYKFYYILYVWLNMSYKVILMQRFYGIIISILIFSPLLNYIFVLLGKSWLNVYILIILISSLKSYTGASTRIEFKKYKYLDYIREKMWNVLRLLNLNNNLIIILQYRNAVSVLSLLIRQQLCTINERTHWVNKYSLYINSIYEGNSLLKLLSSKNLKKYNSKEIICYKSWLIEYKIALSVHSNTDDSWFFNFFDNKLWSNINEIFKFKTELIYPRIQIKYELDKEVLLGYKKLDKILSLIIKVILYYYWNLAKLIKDNNIELKEMELFIDLKISTLIDGSYKLDYWFSQLFSKELRVKDTWLEYVNKIIKNQDFYKYRELYEQMYLYSHIWKFYYIKIYPYNLNNKGINCNEYWYIDKYIDIYVEDLKVLDIGSIENVISKTGLKGKLQIVDLKELDNINYDEEIKNELENYRNELIEGWLEHSKDLTIENFYKKNYENLNQLNEYVKNEINKYTLKK